MGSDVVNLICLLKYFPSAFLLMILGAINFYHLIH